MEWSASNRHSKCFYKGLLLSCKVSYNKITANRQIVAYGFLVFEMLAQNISIGSFTMYVSTIMMFTSALTGLMTGFSEINLYDYYFDDLEEYVSVPRKLRCGTRKVENKSHVIEFCHVSYKYPGSNAFALKDVCIRIR